MKKWIAAGILCLFSQPVMALCLTPLCSCGVSATQVNFGAFNPLDGSARTATGSIQMSCNSTVGLLVPYTIAISTGSGTYANRRMMSGGRSLHYNLFTDATYSTVWGDGTGGSTLVSGSVLLAALASFSLSFTVHGLILGGQNTLVPGTYTDSMTVTLTYY